ncbi:hypothetical protein D3C84_637070 [compost metagenome]
MSMTTLCCAVVAVFCLEASMSPRYGERPDSGPGGLVSILIVTRFYAERQCLQGFQCPPGLIKRIYRQILGVQ